jgi:uncharacterized protein (DUF2147 family)
MLAQPSSAPLFAGSQAPADAILGTWMVPDGDATITISKCGETFCGVISWMEKPDVDKKNPDKSRRTDPLVGLQLLHGFVYSEIKNRWEDGKIYDPDDGNTWNCMLTLDGPDRLKVKGFIGFKWAPIGRTEIWTRTAEKK